MRAIFLAAVAGNLAPQFLRWYSDGGIHLPGATWGQTGGWFCAVGLFALFAGYLATYVWKEKTTQRAFVIGLGLPYILAGAIADVQGMAKPKTASAAEGDTGVVQLRVTRESPNGVEDLKRFRAVAIDRKSTLILEMDQPGAYRIPPAAYRIVFFNDYSSVEGNEPPYKFSRLFASREFSVEGGRTTQVWVELKRGKLTPIGYRRDGLAQEFARGFVKALVR